MIILFFNKVVSLKCMLFGRALLRNITVSQIGLLAEAAAPFPKKLDAAQ